MKFNRFSKIRWIITALVCVALAGGVVAAPKDTASPSVDSSDLNDDGIVDATDLAIFSSKYLKESVDAMDWCAFFVATRGQDRLYKRKPEYYLENFSRLLGFIYNDFACDGSDLNWDGQVNHEDLIIFSARELEQNFDAIEWCGVYEDISLGLRVYGHLSGFYQRHYKILLGYIFDAYTCDDSFLVFAQQNDPEHLARIALDNDYSGNYYVSDAISGSIFIYDPNRILTGELKNLQKPLGLAIDVNGNLLVGNNQAKRIEVYDPATGDLIHVFGEGILKLPNAITIGPFGQIYVTDSKQNTVWVFDASYDSAPVRQIGSAGRGDGQLKFPIDTEIITRDVAGTVHEVFVADQSNHRIQVFDLHGNFLRTLAPPNIEVEVEAPEPPEGWWFGCGWGTPPPDRQCPPEPRIRGSYTRLQALGSDTLDRLHVLDGFDANTVIVDPLTGELIDLYGDWGEGPGLLKVPMDLLVTEWGQAFISDSDNNELEAFVIP
jgi:hypothetical protein